MNGDIWVLDGSAFVKLIKIEGLVSYDARQVAAADALGIATTSPGASSTA